jgi:hypothetical protein
MEQLLAKPVRNPNGKTTNMGPPVEFIEVETILFQWIKDLHREDISIQTHEVILLTRFRPFSVILGDF